MKLLKKIRLINWHSYTNTTIELNGKLVTINGNTGVGKSTIYDAIMYVLTCTDTNFNKAANAKSKRSVEGYVRHKVGTESKAYLREGVVVSHVALEFLDEKNNQPFIIGTVIDSIKEKDAKAWWYKIDNTTIHDDLFIQDKKPLNRSSFERMNSNAEIYKEPFEAKRKLINKLGRFSEKFHDMIPKAIAFKPIDKIEDFITSFLLDEKNLNVNLLKENVRTFQDLEAMVIKTKNQIEKLEAIEKSYNEIQKIKNRNSIQEYIIKRSSLEINLEKEDKLLIDIENNKEQLEALNRSIKKIEIEQEEYKSKIKALELEEKGGDTKIRLEFVINQIKKNKLERDEILIGIETLNELHKKSLNELNQLSSIEKDLHIEMDHITNLTDNLKNLPKVSDISNVISSINEHLIISRKINSKNFDNRAQLQLKKNKLEERIEYLRTLVKDLENKNLKYKPSINLLLEEISKDLKNAGRDDEPRVLCELLTITDKSWQSAIEGYLNTQRFYIMVKPENFNLAKSTYEKLKKSHNLHSVGIINSGGLDNYSMVEDKTLASLIKSDNRYAKFFINKLLGKVRLCDDSREIKKNPISITKDCMLYKNNVVRYLDPNTYQVPYIGAEAYKIQLEQAKLELSEINSTFIEVNRKIELLNNAISIFESENIKDFKDKLHLLSDLDDNKDRLNALREEETELKKDRTLLDIIEKKKQIECKLNEISKSRDNMISKSGGLDKQIQIDTKHLELSKKYTDELQCTLTKYISTIRSIIDDAEIAYYKELNRRSLKEIKAIYEGRLNDTSYKIGKFEEALKGEMEKYNVSYHFGAASELSDYDKYKYELDKLRTHALHKYEEKARIAKEEAELEFKEQFLSKIRENIKTAQIEINRLNSVLTKIKFGVDRYEFKWEPSKKLERYYKMIMNEFNLGGSSLFSEHFNEEQKEVIKELFDKLSLDEIDEKLLQEFTDYRTYMDYDIKIHHENGELSLFSKVNSEKSGGETQSPFYATILSSFVQLYSQSVGGSEDSIGLVLLDEAFNNMDEHRVKGVLEFMNNLPLQVLIASPSDKLELISPYVDDTVIVYKDRHKNVAFAKTFTREINENVIEVC